MQALLDSPLSSWSALAGEELEETGTSLDPKEKAEQPVPPHVDPCSTTWNSNFSQTFDLKFLVSSLEKIILFTPQQSRPYPLWNSSPTAGYVTILHAKDEIIPVTFEKDILEARLRLQLHEHLFKLTDTSEHVRVEGIHSKLYEANGGNKLGCFSPTLVEYLIRAVTGTGTMSCLATSGLSMAKAVAQVLQTSIICPGLWPDQNWSVGVSPEPTTLSSNLSPSSTASPYSSSVPNRQGILM